MPPLEHLTSFYVFATWCIPVSFIPVSFARFIDTVKERPIPNAPILPLSDTTMNGLSIH